MGSKLQPATLADPLRWTYAGDLDDMVEAYPWPSIKAASKRALDVRLAFSAVTGTRMLLNDGYLILNPACFDSLRDKNSPLRVLINEGFVRILSRSAVHSLEDVVIDGEKQGIATYKDLVHNKKKWKATRQVLEKVQKDLTKDSFCGWPGVDLTPSYLELMLRLVSLPHEKRGVAVPDAVFRDTVDRFSKVLSQNPNRARSRWEEIVRKLSQPHFQALMQLGNEVYHHNFGVALAGSPPADLPTNSEIAAETRISNAFLGLYKTHTPRLSAPRAIPPQLQLPGGVDYSQGSSLAPLFLKEQPLGKARTNYLGVRTRYLAGRADAKEMADATKEYQAQLNEHLARCPHEKLTTHIASAAIASVPVALAVAGTVVLPVPTILVATVAFGAAEFGVPIVTEKWSIPKKQKTLFSKSRKLNPLQWAQAVESRGALTALAVDPSVAQQFVKHSPKFP
jgi:hypothetical protein